MPITDITEISSVSDYLDTILIPEDTSDNFWYRGESKDYRDSRVAPSIFRDKGYLERNMYLEFRQRHHETYRHFNNFQWLCLMQHYNLPTRLLDWTTNPLVALYFATRESNSDGYIYEISPGILNNETGSPELFTGENIFVKSRVEMLFWKDPRQSLHSETFHTLPPEDRHALENHLDIYSCHPIALIPEITNVRMAVQSCRFTIHGGNNDLRYKPKQIIDLIDVCAYKIRKENKSLINKNLEKLSIHLGSLFPEIEHTATYLRQKYKNQ